MPRRNPFKSKILLYVGLTVAGVAAAGGGIFGPNSSTVAGSTSTSGTTTVITGASCTTADASQCLSYPYGTFVTFLNPTHADSGSVNATTTSFLYNCSTNILTWAQHASAGGFHQDATVTSVPDPITGSLWPVHVREEYTGGYNPNEVGVKMTTGCVGQGTGAIDLIIDQPIPTGGAGLGDDAFKIDRSAGCPAVQASVDPNRNGTGCPGVNVAGRVNCGTVQTTNGSRNHQDGVQILGGENIGFYDVRIGDWANELFTCEGDGAGFYINAATPTVNFGGTCNTTTGQFCGNWGWGLNITVQRMVSITCIHGVHSQLGSQTGVINPQNSTGTVRHSIFRSNRCANNTYPGPIDASGNNYAAGFASMCSDAPGWNIGGSCGQGDVDGDRWKISSCGFSPCPGFDPANDNR